MKKISLTICDKNITDSYKKQPTSLSREYQGDRFIKWVGKIELAHLNSASEVC
jgi:hypothetical protein